MSALSCLLAALLLGDGGGPDKSEAVLEGLKAACERGTARACVDVGTIYLRGLGVHASRGVAQAFFAKACYVGECGSLAQLQEAAPGRAPDADRVSPEQLRAQVRARGCPLSAEGCRLADALKPDPRPESNLERKCRAGDEQACAQLEAQCGCSLPWARDGR